MILTIVAVNCCFVALYGAELNLHQYMSANNAGYLYALHLHAFLLLGCAETLIVLPGVMLVCVASVK
jgi:hypothetical protein